LGVPVAGLGNTASYAQVARSDPREQGADAVSGSPLLRQLDLTRQSDQADKLAQLHPVESCRLDLAEFVALIMPSDVTYRGTAFVQAFLHLTAAPPRAVA